MPNGKEFFIGTVLYKTKSLGGTKPNTNPKTNPKHNTNPIQLFYAFFEHRPMIFKLASFVSSFSPFQYGTLATPVVGMKTFHIVSK